MQLWLADHLMDHIAAEPRLLQAGIEDFVAGTPGTFGDAVHIIFKEAFPEVLPVIFLREDPLPQ